MLEKWKGLSSFFLLVIHSFINSFGQSVSQSVSQSVGSPEWPGGSALAKPKGKLGWSGKALE